MISKSLTYFLTLVLLFLITAFISRSSSSFLGTSLYARDRENAASKIQYAQFASYRDIPGVTEEDIQAVERIKANRSYLIYGAPFSTEAFLGQDGNIHGFSSYFCKYLSELFGIEISPQLMDWETLIAGMNNNTVDFCGDFSISPEREKILFMTSPIAERAIKYMRMKDAEPLYELAKKRETPLRYGFIANSTVIDLVRNNAPESFVVVEVQTEDEAYKLLSEGAIDAFLTESTAEAAFDKFPDVETFDYIPILYSDVSLSTKNEELKPIITVFQKALNAGIQFHLVELYNKGLFEYLQHKFFLRLTPEELEYLQRKVRMQQPIIYAAEFDNYPLSFYNDIEEEFQGVAIDVIKQISQISGLTFKLWRETPASWSEILLALENGGCSMVTELIKSEDRIERFIWATVGYSKDKYALISTTKIPDKEINEVLYARVGLVANTGSAEAFRKWFQNHTNTVTFYSSQEAFQALTDEEIDLFMGTRNLTLSMTNFMEQPGFKVNYTFNYTFDSYFGFNKDEILLRSIISKAIPVTDAQDISDRWQQKSFDYRGERLRSRIPILLGFSIMLFLLLTLSFLLIKKHTSDKARLADIVEERTKELLMQKDEATKASTAKGDFLARMSHEIRTPMNAIIGMAELALREQPTEEIAEMISNIQNAGNSLLSIINDILDFSKIESDKMELVDSDYHFGSLIQDLINIINARIMGSNLELLVEVDNNLPAILNGDETRLKQILLNLLSNGVKYTKEGTVTLRIEALSDVYGPHSQNPKLATQNDLQLETEKASDTKGETPSSDASGLEIKPDASPVLSLQNDEYIVNTQIFLKISITDTGIGIKPEDLEKLFGSFSQLDKVKNKGIEGTGLGLVISKRLATLMGGDITVQSEYRKGSVFTVTLKQNIPDTYVPLTTLKDPQNSKTIIIEPSEKNSQAYRYNMEKLGADFTLIPDFKQLGETLDAKNFNYLLAPVEMVNPVLDLLKDKGSKIKPAFVTNYGEKSKKTRGLHVLQKPLYSITIANVLNETESRKGVRDKLDHITIIAPTARVMVVDDILINLKVAKGLLSHFKLMVDTANSGAEAIQLFQENYYDLIFMDHMMPGMDGIETTERIRELPGGKNVPIIALTANAIAGVREMFLSHSMNDFISKPIEHGKLESILMEWLPKEKIEELLSEPQEEDSPSPASGQGLDPLTKAFSPREEIASSKAQDPDAKAPILVYEPITEKDSRNEIPNAMEASATVEENPSPFGSGGHAQTSPSLKGGASKTLRDGGFDEQASLEQLGGDKELMQEVLKMYIETTPKLLDELRLKIEPENLPSYAKVAHSIKGSSLNVGAKKVGDLAAVMEKTAKEGDISKVQMQNQEFIETVEGLITQMSDYIRQNS
ncbi:MAG: transporter substrate-binding domain-containing protein [Deltaproteobacteria bacterium]|jgi:signal transduction histidine kinase/CheY-like chemotaxis protein/HPt (histidine-containing phosphotransfer) domain-containing protein|nr:transporter substrate-binding domain-containing protein [Deltaproteobacteria bacterium]